jgi:hypothetical protein
VRSACGASDYLFDFKGHHFVSPPGKIPWTVPIRGHPCERFNPCVRTSPTGLCDGGPLVGEQVPGLPIRVSRGGKTCEVRERWIVSDAG